MPGNYTFWSLFFMTGLGIGLATLVCWLLSALVCWVVGFPFSGGVVLVTVLTTVFSFSFAGTALEDVKEGGSSQDEDEEEDDMNEDLPEDNNNEEEPPNDPRGS